MKVEIRVNFEYFNLIFYLGFWLCIKIKIYRMGREKKYRKWMLMNEYEMY